MSIVSESEPRTDADKAAKYADVMRDAVAVLDAWIKGQPSTYPDSRIVLACSCMRRALKDGGDWRDDG